MSLVNYSSSSGDETDGEELPQIKKPKIQTTQMQQEQQQNTNIKCLLPKAFNKLGADEKVSKIDEYDDPSEHGGRVRSFKHERGNWATYVYIPGSDFCLATHQTNTKILIIVDVNIVEDLQEALCETPIKDSVQLHPSEELHISLSRTIVLQYHLIDSFSKSLENALDVFSSFKVCLRHLKIYTNEDRTRTFVALKVDELYFDKMHKLMKAVDNVMQEYKLATFYEDPSFHTSILWCVGDHVNALNAQITSLESIVQNVERTSEDFKVNINEINCKTGNKHFKFKLK